MKVTIIFKNKFHSSTTLLGVEEIYSRKNHLHVRFQNGAPSTMYSWDKIKRVEVKPNED